MPTKQAPATVEVVVSHARMASRPVYRPPRQYRSLVGAASGLAWLAAAAFAAPDDLRGTPYEGFKDGDDPRILRPSLGLPAILRPGDVLPVLIGSRSPVSADQCRVVLTRCDLAIRCPIQRVRKTATPSDTYLGEVAIPRDVPHPLLYDLQLHVGGRMSCRSNAVRVVPEFTEEMLIVQITDTEINDKDPGPSERLAGVVREINLMGADCVIATGDLTYDGTPRQFDLLVDILRKLDVPVFTQIGNADHHGDESAYFKKVNAFRDYSVDVGPIHLTAFDSGTNYKVSPGSYNVVTDNQGTGLTDGQIAWFEKDLGAAPAHSLRLAFMHFPVVSPFGNRASIHFNRERFMELCERHHVALVLGGHTHVDSVFDQREKLYLFGTAPTTRPCYVQTATTTSRERAPIFPYAYRLIRVKDRQVIRFTYDGDGDGRPDGARSTPTGRLELQFIPSDTGGTRAIAAIVRNNLREAFNNATVVFHVPDRFHHGYRIEGGELVCSVPDGSFTRVIVRTSVLPLSQSTVRLVRR